MFISPARLYRSLFVLALTSTALIAPKTHAQAYDDYSDFAADPVLLDNEASELFGRFFQNSILIGTGVFTGDLGAANSAGFQLGMRFVFYFDKVWGIELGTGYGRHSTLYDFRNTHTEQVEVAMTTHLIPFHLGMRYGFDPETLPRGFATMNPYLAAGAEIIYRSERVIGEPTTEGMTADAQTKFGDFDRINSNALAVNFGGGIEFDVYKNRMLLGFDMRYHVVFWPDAQMKLADPPSTTSDTQTALTRSGGYITVMGSLTYNY